MMHVLPESERTLCLFVYYGPSPARVMWSQSKVGSADVGLCVKGYTKNHKVQAGKNRKEKVENQRNSERKERRKTSEDGSIWIALCVAPFL